MKLLPCPFCGSTELEETECFIQCHGCLCESLKIRWNTRHTSWISVKDRLPELPSEEFEQNQVCVNPKGI